MADVDPSEQLRSWYLARLRSLAHKHIEQASSSPSALVHADRLLISNSLASEPEDGFSTDKLSLFKREKCLAALALVFLTGLGIGLSLDCSIRPLSLLSTGLALSITACLSLLFTIIGTEKRCRAILQGSELSNANYEIDQLLFEFSTLRKEVAKAREAERLTTEFSAELLFLLTADLQILSANCSFLEFFVRTEGELSNLNFLALLPEGQRDRAKASFQHTRNDGKSLQIDLPVKSSKSSSLFISLSADWSETANGFYCVAKDISTLVELERVKKTYVSMLSHDLRAPLQSMELSIDLFTSGKFGNLPDNGIKMLSLVQKNIHRLIKLSTDLLDMDQIEAGRLKLTKEEMSAGELAERSVLAIKDLAQVKDLKIETKLSIENINCDGERIVQVLVNLLSNAIKFSPAGQSIILSGRSLGSYTELSVQDSGPGIPEKYLTSIFDPYSRIDTGNVPKKEGIGLGLAISKSIVELHGGEIGVTSKEGNGAKFWLRIPN